RCSGLSLICSGGRRRQLIQFAARFSSFLRSSVFSSLSFSFSELISSRSLITRFSWSRSRRCTERRYMTCDLSSLSCFCFLIRDRRADSLLDIILLFFLSSAKLAWCSPASSEVAPEPKQELGRPRSCIIGTAWSRARRGPKRPPQPKEVT
ncbi:hypothetical protein MUK42_15930, partial [Musa troglodytarum]